MFLRLKINLRFKNIKKIYKKQVFLSFKKKDKVKIVSGTKSCTTFGPRNYLPQI